ncbi:LIM domain-binding protein 2 [Liparis tanakae]|uniref:LIM domain-binding protein 2 n=1 Tax=Liparis tanakae TaxID=230148 RepID=A0A4Z2FR97_9TELE|nr:LIM domain-binding protein 2 [Liparis tanakae]
MAPSVSRGGREGSEDHVHIRGPRGSFSGPVRLRCSFSSVLQIRKMKMKEAALTLLSMDPDSIATLLDGDAANCPHLESARRLSAREGNAVVCHDVSEGISVGPTLESDSLWWDAFATEFFEEDATLTLSFCLEDGPKRYSKCIVIRFFFYEEESISSDNTHLPTRPEF